MYELIAIIILQCIYQTVCYTPLIQTIFVYYTLMNLGEFRQKMMRTN